jgi:hypothetical protein
MEFVGAMEVQHFMPEGHTAKPPGDTMSGSITLARLDPSYRYKTSFVNKYGNPTPYPQLDSTTTSLNTIASAQSAMEINHNLIKDGTPMQEWYVPSSNIVKPKDLLEQPTDDDADDETEDEAKVVFPSEPTSLFSPSSSSSLSSSSTSSSSSSSPPFTPFGEKTPQQKLKLLTSISSKLTRPWSKLISDAMPEIKQEMGSNTPTSNKASSAFLDAMEVAGPDHALYEDLNSPVKSVRDSKVAELVQSVLSPSSLSARAIDFSASP